MNNKKIIIVFSTLCLVMIATSICWRIYDNSFLPPSLCPFHPIGYSNGRVSAFLLYDKEYDLDSDVAMRIRLGTRVKRIKKRPVTAVLSAVTEQGTDITTAEFYYSPDMSKTELSVINDFCKQTYPMHFGRPAYKKEEFFILPKELLTGDSGTIYIYLECLLLDENKCNYVGALTLNYTIENKKINFEYMR